MNIILTLADDRSIIESLRAALPRTDLLLFESTVEEGLRRLVGTRADAVLLDDAPNLGLPALERLLEAAPEVPVIVLVSTNNPDTLATYTMAGAKACISKPFQCEDLGAAIRDLAAPSMATAPPSVALNAAQAPPTGIAQHQAALRWMSRSAAHFEDTPRMLRSLLDAIVDIFDPARACVLLQTNGSVRVVESHGLPDAITDDLRLSFNSGLMRRMEETPALIERDQESRDANLNKELHLLGGQSALPLIAQGRPCGALVVGEKANGQRYSSEDGELIAVMVRSVSACLDRARRQRDVTRQQNRLDAVLANITAGVVTIAPDKTVTMMNESAERILQLQAPNVLGRSVQKLGSAFADVVLRTLHEGTPRLRQQINDPSIHAELGLSVTPLGAEGVVAIFSLLPESQAEADIAYSPIWKFLSNRVAQEIKNPMVAINTFAQLLPTKYKSTEFRTEFAEVVQKEVERINSVVETLYDFSGRERLTLKACDLSENVDQILHRFDEDLAARSIQLETEFDTNDTPVKLDETQFARAIENVVQNCIDAMPEGGVLKVTTRRDNGICHLIISDSGQGINEQDAPLIFTPFFSTKEKGMGMGLTMASRIVQEHEGHMALQTDTEGGGSFAIDLPTALDTAEEQPPDEA